ncbi:PPR: pentatricopeptide repeat domain containing protein [Nitzschia inconspicua]|uniref:PPR: pentatricopeptide repeat domain containing protein n=1 Tax=Nitzschia inconspicua TaxID=303405 RepID=A0A9K3KYE4_9STRA|nr:PPR: pentatricopeptide repeat domain containing protein [Nitzschia inconspicua]
MSTRQSLSIESVTTAKRRATFVLAVAYLFGSSSSLSSSSQRRGLKALTTKRGGPLQLEGSFGSSPLQLFDTDASVNQTLAVRNRRANENCAPVSLVDSFRQVRKAVLQELRQDNNFDGAKLIICGMIDHLKDYSCDHDDDVKSVNAKIFDSSVTNYTLSPESRWKISEIIDEALQAFYARAFATPFRPNDHHRVELGVELLNLQFQSTTALSKPFFMVPKRAIVQALAAVTMFQEQQYPSRSNTKQRCKQHSNSANSLSPEVAFRLLQRLVTGVGVRHHSSGTSRKVLDLYEVDFNRVLNVYSNLGNMDMAHRVIALQERTPHAPSLSPVTYSILVKGYGRLGDWNNIDMLLQHAAASDIVPDTILFNSFMDAYINCKQLRKARRVFDAMTGDTGMGNAEFPFAVDDCPSPNLRTFNILLKGLAQAGQWAEAQSLAKRMKHEPNLWDDITTNTLVQAATEAKEFQAAEAILREHTVLIEKRKNRYHPNADAYTSLIDGYCKSGKVDRAMALIKTMTDRGVEPNEFHFSSLIGGLARQKRIEQAQKILLIVGGLDLPPKSQRAIYNAFIAGLVHCEDRSVEYKYDKYVDEALKMLREMMQAKITPDVHTVAVILDGFGHCQVPRMKEAAMLVRTLEERGIIPQDNIIVSTALVRVFAAGGDLEGARDAFQRIRRPDVAAVNAFIDAAVRCGQIAVAMETFERFFPNKESRLKPDVVSFSTLINAHLKKGTFDGSRAARDLYDEMKFRRRLLPDKTLVDIIIRGMVENSRTCGVQAADARFLAGTLRDAEELIWNDGQLEQRKRVVQLAMSKQMANAWEEESNLYGLRKQHVRNYSQQSSIFQRHGWNQVDSGFRLWGAGRSSNTHESKTDEFLKSKGWNDMDSGFRII